ncbi:Complement component 1 Q subcomponent binding [Echinococcus multilocularis]|uniref:Complement component 1 Q subcomponent binding n=1 Tax=Echinococcus multilocularis TaxID=6211 RepID=A0A068YH94_ECHMU|nr:Complement component 1 Q subcomponent binding [Echinococcus multilocularis]
MSAIVRRFPTVLGTVARYSRCFCSFQPIKSYTYCNSALKSRFFSSDVDRQFSAILTEEIKQEKENSFACRPPVGFEVDKQDGTSIVLKKVFPDGVVLEVEMDLAGSIAPEDVENEEPEEKDQEEASPLEARPDLKIRLRKPSGRSVLFHCSLPSSAEEAASSEQDSSNLPTFSVDMVEVENIPGYFVYTDLFADNMYDHIMRLLTERGVDYDFQRQVQDFATAEEHKLYRSFLEEFKDYCKE